MSAEPLSPQFIKYAATKFEFDSIEEPCDKVSLILAL